MILTACVSLLVVLVCIDMGIKQYVEDNYEENEEHETVIPGVLIRKVYNKGFAFNILDRYPEIIKQSSVCSSVGIVLYDFFVFLRKGRKMCKLGMALVTAGAVSNIYDRLIREKVIDYIGVRSKNSYVSKLTANFADIYIVLGMMIVSLSRITNRKKKRQKGRG